MKRSIDFSVNVCVHVGEGLRRSPFVLTNKISLNQVFLNV